MVSGMEKPTAKEIQAILNTQEGKRLLLALQADGGTALSQAAALIKGGSADQAMALLEPMLNTPKTKALIDQIQQKIG